MGRSQTFGMFPGCVTQCVYMAPSVKPAVLPSYGWCQRQHPQNRSCLDDPAASGSTISTSYPIIHPRIDADSPSAPKGPMHFQWGSRSLCQCWPSPLVLALFIPRLSQFSMSPGQGRHAEVSPIARPAAGHVPVLRLDLHTELTGSCCWDTAAYMSSSALSGTDWQHWVFWHRENSGKVSPKPMLMPIFSL